VEQTLREAGLAHMLEDTKCNSSGGVSALSTAFASTRHAAHTRGRAEWTAPAVLSENAVRPTLELSAPSKVTASEVREFTIASGAGAEVDVGVQGVHVPKWAKHVTVTLDFS
jgi:hypothetical protein